MDKYRQISKIVEAIQYTQEMQDKFESETYDKTENPQIVRLEGIDCDLWYNWHTKKLSIVTPACEDLRIYVDDYIVKIPAENRLNIHQRIFYRPFNKILFENNYEKV